jgi:hypothetical protein
MGGRRGATISSSPGRASTWSARRGCRARALPTSAASSFCSSSRSSPSLNRVAPDLSFVRILVVAPDRDADASAAGLLSPATLAWLDAELGSASGDCWIACHWPLRATVTGDTRRVFSSVEPFFHAKPDADLRALLARHPTATAWISGHTHSPLDAPGLVSRLVLGGRGVACVNASAIAYTGRTREWTDPLASIFLTHRPGTIEVRFRDHGAGVWTSASHQRVAAVAVAG